MPFELGVDYGSRRFASNHLKNKKFLILERKPHDYKKALSDLSGVDIKNHGDKPPEVDTTPLGMFTLTSVGIAIANANIIRKAKLQINLSDWIR